VREVARRARDGALPARPEPTQWRVFSFVYPDEGDAPVRQEPYFLIGADGIVQALFSDARGEWADWRFAAGDPEADPVERSAAEKY
jgi:hypothetical protein